MQRFGLLLSFVAVFGVALVGMQEAEAKRLGGGKSFGGRPAYSTPYNKRSVTPSRPSQRQQAAQQQNTQRRAQLANRGGLMGLLGGLALGGLLGALFFGGAFENINFLDIVIFGLIAFMLYKLFAARARHSRRQSGRGTQAGGASATAGGNMPPEMDPGREVRRSWGLDSAEMERKFATGQAGRELASQDEGVDQAQSSGSLPPDFDETAFLAGADRAYRMLQDAWDRGDVEQMKRFTTDSVFAELRSQIQDRQGDNRTQILKLDAELLETERVGANLEAAVLFDAYLREEDAASASPEEGHRVREVWHFVRPADAREPTWYLDGIQQLED